MLFSLSTNCCTADTILRILCQEPQHTGDRRTVLERLAHHGDIGVRIGRSSGSHRQELLADILHRKSDVLELFHAQSWSRYSFRSTISAFLLFSQYSILYAEYQIIFPFRKLLFYQTQYFLIMEIVRYEA